MYLSFPIDAKTINKVDLHTISLLCLVYIFDLISLKIISKVINWRALHYRRAVLRIAFYVDKISCDNADEYIIYVMGEYVLKNIKNIVRVYIYIKF